MAPEGSGSAWSSHHAEAPADLFVLTTYSPPVWPDPGGVLAGERVDNNDTAHVNSRFFPLMSTDEDDQILSTTTTTSLLNQGAEDGMSNAELLKFINYIAYDIVANFIVFIGIVSNMLNLIVLTRPKLKGVMYVYLLGLAVSNLFVLVTAIPALTFVTGKRGSDTYAEAFFLAHFEIPMLNSFMAASVYIIICMTVNRYISIYHPTHFQRIHTFKNAYIAIAFSFAGGIMLHIPLTLYQKVQECPKDKDCIYETIPNKVVTAHQLYNMYTFISEALLRFAPIITLTILNILIIIRFNRIARKREVLKGHRGSAASAAPSGIINATQPSQPDPTSMAVPTMAQGTTVTLKATGSNGIAYTVKTAPSMGSSGNTLTVNGGCKDQRRLTIDDPRRLSTDPPPVLPDPITNNKTSHSSNHSSNASGRSRCGSLGGGSHNGTHRRSTATSAASSKFHRVSTRRRGLHSPEERMLVVVLIAIVVLFVICTTPAAFLSIFYDEAKTQAVWFTVFRAAANNLELLGFALNFFVYCLCSADIRRAFVDVLFQNPLWIWLAENVLSSKRSTHSGSDGDIAAAAAAVHNSLSQQPPQERSIYNGGGEESIAMRSVGPWGVDGVSGRHSSSTPEHSCHSGPPPPPVETQPDHNLLPSGVVVNKIVMSSDNSRTGTAASALAPEGVLTGDPV